MMRMAMVAEFVESESRFAAFSRRVWAIVGYMRSRGWQVQVLSPRIGKNSSEAKARGDVRRLVQGYSAWRSILGSPIASILAPVSVIGYLHSLRKFRPDVVIIAASNAVLLLETTVAARLLGIAIVFDVHDSWLVADAVYPGRVRNWLRRKLEGFALRGGEVVVGVTSRQAHTMRRGYQLNARKVMTIYSGATPSVRTQGQCTPRYDFVHAGPPRSNYNTQALLDALAILIQKGRCFRTAFLGTLPGGDTKHWTAEAARRGLLRWVDFLPPVPPARITETLSDARVGLVTLGNESVFKAAISTKSFDYLSAGLPILYLGPKDSEQAELIERFGVGLVVDSPSAFADAAERILLDDRVYADLQTNAEAAALDLAWNVLLEPLHRRLVQFVDSRPQRGPMPVS